MNAYTTRTRARIQPGDIVRATLTDPSIAAISLATLERQRGYQAEAELAWLLKQHGMPPASVWSRIVMLRQTLGAALVRAGECLAGASKRAVTPESGGTAGRLSTAR